MFLLDTNVISELRRPERANPGIRMWATGVRQTELYLSVITLLEIEVGILRLDHRNDYAQAVLLRAWMNRVQQSFGSDFAGRYGDRVALRATARAGSAT